MTERNYAKKGQDITAVLQEIPSTSKHEKHSLLGMSFLAGDKTG